MPEEGDSIGPSNTEQVTSWKRILQNDLQNEVVETLLSPGAPGRIRTSDPQIRSLRLPTSSINHRLNH